MKCGLILSSGGLDSVTCGKYIYKKLGYSKLKVIFFNYGQKSLNNEKVCAKILSRDINAEFIQIDIPFYKDIINNIGSSEEIALKDLKDSKKQSEKWYFPCRNTLFITYALALAEKYLIDENKKYDLFVGFKCEGKDTYPDATSKFLKDMNLLSKNSTKGKFRLFAPFIKKDKEDIIKIGSKLNVDFDNTFSCYNSEKLHCGQCLACRLRQEGFYWANITDKTKYLRKPKDFRVA